MPTRILLFVLLRLHWSLLDLVHEDERWRQLAESEPTAPWAAEIAQTPAIAPAITGEAST